MTARRPAGDPGRPGLTAAVDVGTDRGKRTVVLTTDGQRWLVTVTP